MQVGQTGLKEKVLVYLVLLYKTDYTFSMSNGEPVLIETPKPDVVSPNTNVRHVARIWTDHGQVKRYLDPATGEMLVATKPSQPESQQPSLVGKGLPEHTPAFSPESATINDLASLGSTEDTNQESRIPTDEDYKAAVNLLHWYKRFGQQLEKPNPIGMQADVMRNLGGDRAAIPPEIGSRFDGHGITDMGVTPAVNNLRNLLRGNLDQQREFYTARLRQDDATESGMAAIDGTAGPFSDGLFILVIHPDEMLIQRLPDGSRKIDVAAVIVDSAVFEIGQNSEKREQFLRHLAKGSIFKPEDIERLRNTPNLIDLLHTEFPGVRLINSADLANPSKPGGPLVDMINVQGTPR